MPESYNATLFVTEEGSRTAKGALVCFVIFCVLVFLAHHGSYACHGSHQRESGASDFLCNRSDFCWGCQCYIGTRTTAPVTSSHRPGKEPEPSLSFSPRPARRRPAPSPKPDATSGDPANDIATKLTRQLQVLAPAELVDVNLTLAANNLYAAGPLEPGHLNNVPEVARLMGWGVTAVANQGPQAVQLLQGIVLDVLTARSGAAAIEEAAVLPSTGPIAIAKRRKAAAPVEAPWDGTLSGALRHAGVRILSDLGAAGGTAAARVAGVPFGGGGRPGLDGTGVAPTSLVS
jgi:hypothetical protein